MRSVRELEDRLATPHSGLIEDLAAVPGDLTVLGATGKLGPSLTRLAVQALRESGSTARVYAVSRFRAPGSAQAFADLGAEPIVCDIADDQELATLPRTPSVVYLVGAKFGSTGQEAATWYTNTYLPGRVAEHFHGCRISALSTGNVYPFSAPGSEPSEERDPAPVGEYAMSCLGRERVMEALGARHGTPLSLIRLNYAVEMRYGVLIDLGLSILGAQPIDLATGYVNLVWQGYANEVTLRALRHAASPDPFVLNVTGDRTWSVRHLATELGRRIGVEPIFSGSESRTALLSDAARCADLFGSPEFSVKELLDHTAAWLREGSPTLGKPTGFERRDGRF